MKRLLKLRYIVVSFSVLILLWYLLASVSSVGEALFPKPLTVGKALVDLFADGTMGANIGASLYRFAIGYVTSVVSAAILGLIIGWFKPLYGYISPILQITRPIAPVAWMPLLCCLLALETFPQLLSFFLQAFFRFCFLPFLLYAI